MLGCSPHKSRRQLLAECATGITPEVDPATQRRFNNGHRLEALARPMAEQIVGEPLYPVTGTNGRYSASFDGLTLGGETAFEHKALNGDIRAAFQSGADLPMHYRVQMEHQLLVSGAGRVLFVASDWDAAGNLLESHHRWVESDPVLRERIVAGWTQFAADLMSFEPAAPAEAAPVGTAPETLPALRIEVEGTVIASNLQTFRETAITAIRHVRRDLTTDQDFADAELSVKWCREVETRIDAAKAHALSQTASIEELFRTLDDVSAEARRVRLDLEKLVRGRKDEIRTSIVVDAQRALAKHVAMLSAETMPFELRPPAADFGGAVKGKRSITAMHDAVDHALADAKMAADAEARVVRANVAAFRDMAAGRESLFPDGGKLIGMEPAAFRELVAGRIARADAENAERARKAAEAATAAAPEAATPPAVLHQTTGPGAPETAAAAAADDDFGDGDEAASEPATLSLGDINARLGITMSAAFIANTLQVAPAGRNRRALLFTDRQFRAICQRLASHVHAVSARTRVREVATIGDES
jgi:predicted phage-related endonuclease